MKKYVPHILIGVLAIAIIIMLATGDNSRNKVDERITLRKKDKIPYGSFIAFQGLDSLFPDATISVNRNSPENWDRLSTEEKNQALVIITTKFSANEQDMEKLVEFARNGNDVFLSTVNLSSTADKVFDFVSSGYSQLMFSQDALERNFRCTLSAPPFGKPLKYFYPGITFGSYFSVINASTTFVLGRNDNGQANFVHLKIGEGNFYIQLEPLVFSNYFLLYRNNIAYFEQAMSLIRPDVKTIVWDEYFINKKDDPFRRQKKDGWFRVLMRYPAFRAALLTAFLTLLVYVLMEMRRKQRLIPVIRRPRNESLDFVKTIGRLYYEKGNHRNLGKKMSAYFLEHVRNRYKLLTNSLDQEFITSLHYKTGVPVAELEEIIAGIKEMDTAATISAGQLTALHRKLEAFYARKGK